MQHLNRPVSAGEQLSLSPESTGQPTAGDQASPTRPHDHDTTTPADSASIAPAAVGTSPGNAQMLARLVAEGRRPRSQRFAELEPYRDVLLAERRANASIRLLAQSLARLGVKISEETLRVWLLRQKMPKRRRPRKKPASSVKPKLGAAMTPQFVPVLNPVLYPKPALPRRSPNIARDDF